MTPRFKLLLRFFPNSFSIGKAPACHRHYELDGKGEVIKTV